MLNLIRSETLTPPLTEWAQRLGIDLNQPHVVEVVEVDSAMSEL
nr:Sugar diacid regulator [Candidatus Pantoea persica]